MSKSGGYTFQLPFRDSYVLRAPELEYELRFQLPFRDSEELPIGILFIKNLSTPFSGFASSVRSG